MLNPYVTSSRFHQGFHHELLTAVLGHSASSVNTLAHRWWKVMVGYEKGVLLATDFVQVIETTIPYLLVHPAGTPNSSMIESAKENTKLKI